MSNRAVNWVWENAPDDINPTELLLLVALADQGDDYGRTSPSNDYMARKLRMHIDTVTRNMHSLIRRGLVLRTLNRGRANQYQVVMAPPVHAATPPQPTPPFVAGGSGQTPPQMTPPQIATPPQPTPPHPSPPETKPTSGHLSRDGGVGEGVANPDASQAPPAPPPKAPRGTRLQEDWVPPEPSRRKLLERYPGLPKDWWLTETEKFINHFTSIPGKAGLKLNWTKAWVNWIHNSVSRLPGDLRVAARQPAKSTVTARFSAYQQALDDEDISA